MSCTVTPIENGPLKLQSDEAITFDESLTLEPGKPVFLCRCGASKKKPFCDGSHKAAGFTSDREISDEIQQHYPGKSVSINFNRSICAGAANCVHGLPSVFKSDNSDHWIFPNNDSNKNIAEAVARCPSGALSYSVNEKVVIDPPTDVRMSIAKDGPYHVQAIALEITATEAHLNGGKYSLCRCGHSKNKPFCDYSHAEQHWTDSDSDSDSDSTTS
jgi:CDGSH-type Zn-finger protein/ferredoxin